MEIKKEFVNYLVSSPKRSCGDKINNFIFWLFVSNVTIKIGLLQHHPGRIVLQRLSMQNAQEEVLCRTHVYPSHHTHSHYCFKINMLRPIFQIFSLSVYFAISLFCRTCHDEVQFKYIATLLFDSLFDFDLGRPSINSGEEPPPFFGLSYCPMDNQPKSLEPDLCHC